MKADKYRDRQEEYKSTRVREREQRYFEDPNDSKKYRILGCSPSL